MQFENMLQKCFNCSYRGSTSLGAKMIRTFYPLGIYLLKAAIESLEQGIKSY